MSNGYVQGQEGAVVAKGAAASVARSGRAGRFCAPRKTQAVLRLLRGEDPEFLSRDLGVVASTLSPWREAFLATGQLALKGNLRAIGQSTIEETLQVPEFQELVASLSNITERGGFDPPLFV
jgi:hypothetical protein